MPHFCAHFSRVPAGPSPLAKHVALALSSGLTAALPGGPHPTPRLRKLGQAGREGTESAVATGSRQAELGFQPGTSERSGSRQGPASHPRPTAPAEDTPRGPQRVFALDLPGALFPSRAPALPRGRSAVCPHGWTWLGLQAVCHSEGAAGQTTISPAFSEALDGTGPLY